jgi:hypothetical protein
VPRPGLASTAPLRRPAPPDQAPPRRPRPPWARRAALDVLPEPERAAVALAFERAALGLLPTSPADVALRLAVTRQAAASILHRAQVRGWLRPVQPGAASARYLPRLMAGLAAHLGDVAAVVEALWDQDQDTAAALADALGEKLDALRREGRQRWHPLRTPP